MTWFLVDDKLHSNRKIRELLADEPAALALWTVAGSWSSDELTDGFIPDSQLPWLFPAGAEQLAQKLIDKRLWRRVRGGYQFHEWAKDGDGTRRNRTRAEVLEERRKKAEAGRIGGLASGKTRSKPKAGAKASAEAKTKHRGLNSDPPPSNEGGSGSAPASPGGAPPVNPAVDSPPNGHIADDETRTRLAAEAKAAIRRPKTAPRHDPLNPLPDKGQTALDRLDAAIAEHAKPLEHQ